ncbi:MAG: hypothetical protein PHY08_10545 [Candidatus Cloacimonetes bacterium]|jgi:hypothetical protein|nr:hypothetical protein [Candidatus Cloacimonadota bacterium]
MNEIVASIIGVVVTSVVVPLITLLGAKLTQWINGKIKNEETGKIIEEVNQIVTSNVAYVFQTYVDNLKKKDKFDDKAQNYALRYAQEKILNELSEVAKEYILENYGDINGWIITQIESTIYEMRKV